VFGGKIVVLYPSAGPPQVRDLGAVHPQDCEVCQCEQPFRLHLSYRYERVWLLFGNLRGRSYLLVCDVCKTSYSIPRDVALRLARLEREPIPFLHRYGCFLLWLAFLALAAASVLLEWL
jgi:hypothetical protein